MKQFLHEGTCRIRDILSWLDDKWSLLVPVTLSANGTMCFSDFKNLSAIFPTHVDGDFTFIGSRLLLYSRQKRRKNLCRMREIAGQTHKNIISFG